MDNDLLEGLHPVPTTPAEPADVGPVRTEEVSRHRIPAVDPGGQAWAVTRRCERLEDGEPAVWYEECIETTTTTEWKRVDVGLAAAVSA